jgi:hypothetical protein
MKKFLIIIGVIVVLMIIVLVIGISNLGPIIKTAVNTYGPKITQTEVHVADVSVSLLSGEANLKNFLLGNPQGFTAQEAIRVGSISVNVDEKSLTTDTIVIDAIEVVKPIITYEKMGGTDNFKSLLDNINRSSSRETAPDTPQEEGPGKKLIIRDFIIKEGTVNLAMTSRVGGKTVSAQLSELHLKNIGGDQGSTPAEAFKQIFAALYKKIGSPAIANILEQGLQEGLGSTRDAVKQEEGKATDKVKGLFGK